VCAREPEGKRRKRGVRERSERGVARRRKKSISFFFLLSAVFPFEIYLSFITRERGGR
jgi:hypothetical protein